MGIVCFYVCTRIDRHIDFHPGEKILEGELVSVDKITWYLLCVKCGRKIDIGGEKVQCTNSNCMVNQKAKFCSKNLVAKMSFIEETTNKLHNITAFKTHVEQIVKQDVEKMKEHELIGILLDTEGLTVSVNQDNVLTNISFK